MWPEVSIRKLKSFPGFWLEKSIFHYYLIFHSLGLIWGLADSQELENMRFANAAISSLVIHSTNHGLSDRPNQDFAF